MHFCCPPSSTARIPTIPWPGGTGPKWPGGPGPKWPGGEPTWPGGGLPGIPDNVDPREYLEGVPAERVWQHHLAGHTNDGNLIIDTHDQDVIDPVWALYEETAKRFGPVSTMIERDGNIPALDRVLEELEQARRIAQPFYDNDEDA